VELWRDKDRNRLRYLKRIIYLLQKVEASTAEEVGRFLKSIRFLQVVVKNVRILDELGRGRRVIAPRS